MKPRRERDTEQSFGLVWFGLVFVLFCLENHLWWIDEDGEQDKGDPVEQSRALVWFLFCLENHLWWIVKDGEQDKGDPVEQCRGLSGQWRRRGSTSASSYH